MRTLLFLFAVCSSVLATGHLRLDITATHDCDLTLSTDLSASPSVISLQREEIKTSSFHPTNGGQSITIAFSVGQDTRRNRTFALETSQQTRRDVFVFSEITVLVESTVECDPGFYGPLCTSNQKPTTSSSTSSTTSTTTTTTTTTVISTATQETSLIPSSQTVTPLPLQYQTSLLIIVLTFVIITLVILLIVVCLLLLTRQRNVYIEPTCKSPEINKKWMDTSFDNDSGIQSPESVRYTSAPFRSFDLYP